MSLEPFIAFVPLSNWTRGFDRYAMRYSKQLIGESKYPDCFYMMKEGEELAPAIAKTKDLIGRLNIAGDRVVALRAMLHVGAGGMEPNVHSGTGVGWRWPHPWIPLTEFGLATDAGSFRRERHETLTAMAYKLKQGELASWVDCTPRTFSVLPIARACNATCAFCFSKASVSELASQVPLKEEVCRAWAKEARARGASRAVITGGGEPGLLGWGALERLSSVLSCEIGKVLLITNGSQFADLESPELRKVLARLSKAGLTRIAISRHGTDEVEDQRIMGLGVDGAKVARVLNEHGEGPRLRSICVLQKGGVDSPARVEKYLRRMAREGFGEVCFKELYVSALSENPWAPSVYNLFSESNQVPLHMVVLQLERMEFVERERLPWGSPVYEGVIEGVSMRVAAYTEPSVGWERSHRMVRSWNLMADGTCFASLEDPASKLELRCL
jgi:hypothetical protein